VPLLPGGAMTESQAGRRLALFLLLTPVVLWLGLLILLPHVEMLTISLRERVSPQVYRFSLKHYAAFFAEPLYWITFARTALYSLLVTAITLVIAFPIAYVIAKIARGRAKSVLFILCLLPFWVSELVRTLGWMILLRESGVVSRTLQILGISGPVEFLYNDAAMVTGLVYTSLLFMLVPLVTTLEGLDDALVEAGYDLGGNWFTVLREIVIPFAMPGIVSGCIVVFMLSLGNYVAATLLGGKSSLWFTEQIYSQFITRFNWEQGSAFGFLLLVLSSLMVWIGLKLSGQTLSSTMDR
jgi:spermidine/putrescine transport system permease protein